MRDITSKQVEMLACKPRLEAESEVEVVVVLVTPIGTGVYSRRTNTHTTRDNTYKILAMRNQDDAWQFNTSAYHLAKLVQFKWKWSRNTKERSPESLHMHVISEL